MQGVAYAIGRSCESSMPGVVFASALPDLNASAGYWREALIDDLQKQAEEIEEAGIKLLEKADLNDESYGTNKVFLYSLDYNDPLRKGQRELIFKYQQWYSTSLQVVDLYIPEWVEEFKSCYSVDYSHKYGLIDYLRLGILLEYSTRGMVISSYMNKFERQLSILLSIPSVVEVKEFGLRELITADVARTEIEQAEILLDSGFDRAAGSIAGVALELHLKTLCDVNGVSYPPKPTIETLVQALYKEEKLDVTELKQIQYLVQVQETFCARWSTNAEPK